MKDNIYTLPTPEYDPMTDAGESRRRVILLENIIEGLREYDATVCGFTPEYDAVTGKLEALHLKRESK